MLKPAPNAQQGVAAPVDIPVVTLPCSPYLDQPTRSEGEVSALRALNDMRDQAHADATAEAFALADVPLVDEMVRKAQDFHDRMLALHRKADGLSDDTGLFCNAISDAIGALRKAADAASGE